MRRLPRPGAVLQRRVRRPELRRRKTTRRPRPASPAPSATRSRTSTAPVATPTTRSRRRSHYPFAFSENSGAAAVNNQLIKAKPDVSQEDVPQAVPQDGRVLLDLPQGALAGRAEPLQGVPARPEPLRHVHPERRLRPRRAELLLSAQGRRRTAPAATCRCSRLATTSARRTSTTRDAKIHDHLFPAANTGVACAARRRRRPIIAAHQAPSS